MTENNEPPTSGADRKNPHRDILHGERDFSTSGFAQVEKIAGRAIRPEERKDPEARELFKNFLIAVRAERLRRHKAETLAYQDALTGLPNLHAFNDTFLEKIETLRDPSKSPPLTPSTGTPPRENKLTVALVDLNFLKLFNDGTEYGFNHATGNEVLKYVASKLKKHFRRKHNDLIAARVGGDEFGIVSYGADINQTKRYLEAVAYIIQGAAAKYFAEKGRPLLFKGKPVPITISFGCYEITGKDLDEPDNTKIMETAWANASIAEMEHKTEVKKELRISFPDFVTAAEEVRRKSTAAESTLPR